MNAVRTALMTGAAALSLGALAVTVSVPPESMRTIQVARPGTLAADVAADAQGAPTHPSEEDVDSALALIEQLAPVADGHVVTVRLDSQEHPGTVTIAPVAPRAAAAADSTEQAEDGDPEVQNAASDLINDVYSISRYWANYVSLELGPWLINWVPFGYLISDQIYIWYPNFVLPTVDSFVYDFLDPVVNDPTNPDVWIDGLGAILNTAANGIASGVADEINYIVTFGWFPIPLPPLPDFPLPALSSASATAASASALTEGDPGPGTAVEFTIEPVDEGNAQGTDTSDEPVDTATDVSEPADTEEPAGTATDTEGAADGATGTDVSEPAGTATDTEGAAEGTTGERTAAPNADDDAITGDPAEEDIGEPGSDGESVPSDESEALESDSDAQPGDDADGASGPGADSNGAGSNDADSNGSDSNGTDDPAADDSAPEGD